MKRRSRPASNRCRPALARPQPDPEVVGFIAAVLRQMDHAAALVVAFFRSLGMLGPDEMTVRGLPREFLLELAALLQWREWHASGVVEWSDPDGLSIDDRIRQAIECLQKDPEAVAASRQGTQAMLTVLRTWTESCCPSARQQVGCDVSLQWDAGLDLDQLMDAFAEFLCRHRDLSFESEGR